MKNLSSLFFRATVALAAAGSLLGAATGPSSGPSVRVDARLDRPVVYAGSPGKVVVQIDLSPEAMAPSADRVPVNLALVLDRSGSMSGGKMARAIDAAELAVSRLSPEDIVSVVIYDDRIDTLAEASPASLEYKALIQRKLRGVGARGSTAIYGGLSQAAAELRKFAREGYVNRIVLLSDGLANRGPRSVSDFEGLARAFAAEDFIVSTIGLGLDYDEDIMTALAAAGQGNTYFVETAADLPRIFEKELGDVLSVAATSVEIIIRPRAGVRVIRGIGRKADLGDGSAVRVRIPQLYGGLDKFALLELEVPAGETGERRELLDIEVSYREALGGEVRRREIVVPVTYSEREETVAASVQKDVVGNVAVNRIAESRVRAVEHADAGNRRQAGDVLRSAADELRRDYDRFGAADVVAPASAPLAGEAAEIEESGLSRRARKEYKSGSYQTVNQQE